MKTTIFEYIKKNTLIIIALVIYALITLPIALNHTSHWDESHAWMLAQWINPNNIIDILRTEGHPIGWFLVLAPFAKLNIAHPYSMYFINWLFCFLAILVIWLRAPFKNYFKLAITFSSIFLTLFPIVARNYSLGILILFLLCALKENQTNYPIKYSILIVLAMHIHAFFLLAAIVFAIDFIVILTKQFGTKSKQLWIPLLLISASILLFIFPYLTGYGSEQSAVWAPPGLKNFIKFILIYKGVFLFLYLAITTFLFSLKSNIFSKILLAFTSFGMIYFYATFYSGSPHHYVLLLIYLIIAIWTGLSTPENNHTYKSIAIQILCSILLLIPLHNTFKYLHVPNATKFINTIKKQKFPKNAIFILTEDSRYLLPYLEKNFNIVDCYTLDKFNYQTYNKPSGLRADLNSFYSTYSNIYIINRTISGYNFSKLK